MPECDLHGDNFLLAVGYAPGRQLFSFRPHLSGKLWIAWFAGIVTHFGIVAHSTSYKILCYSNTILCYKIPFSPCTTCWIPTLVHRNQSPWHLHIFICSISSDLRVPYLLSAHMHPFLSFMTGPKFRLINNASCLYNAKKIGSRKLTTAKHI